jgi:hypothetical protein
MQTNDRTLTFPQRNWLLLCILVAILSPLVVHWIQAAAHHESYEQSTHIRPTGNEAGGSNPPAGAPAGNDTSYKVASPANTTGGADSGKKGGASDSGSK